MARGPFEQANIAVIEAAYLNVEWTQTADGVSAAQDAPTASGDGISLRKSTRGIVAVKPSAGQTCDAKVYAYLVEPAMWVELTEAARTGITDAGNSWKINTGGASEIYVQVLTLSGGTADAWYGRSYVV
jgi:hypothetical protein